MIRVTYRPAPGAPLRRMEVDESRDAMAVVDRCRELIYPSSTRGGEADASRTAPKRSGGSAPRAEAAPTSPGAVSHIRDTSHAAYDKLRATGKLGKQEQFIYDLVRGSGELNRDWTRQEIAYELHLGINAVCGRVHALIHEHALLEERARRACTVTGETANPVGVAP